VAATAESTEPSRVFLIALFVGAVAIGLAIIYLGMNGFIGGTIP
jgi:hypothetical protein